MASEQRGQEAPRPASSKWAAKTEHAGTVPALMTAEEVAKRLNMSDSFVYAAIASGRLKHHRLGRSQGGIRVSEEQLAAFLGDTERSGGAVKPPKTPPRPKQTRAVFRHLPPP